MNRPQSEVPPYAELCYLFKRAKVVPFLGAGASLSEGLAEEAGMSLALPTGRELAYRLAELTGLSRDEVDIYNLLEVASLFELMRGRFEMEEELERVFNRKQEPNPIHRFLAETSAPLIVTTNYDTLIERAFQEQGREFHLLMTPIHGMSHSRYERHVLWWAPGADEPRRYATGQLHMEPENLPVIYKIHGGFDSSGKWHGPVITEDDYFEIGGRIYESSLLPPQISAMLQHKSLLFLGYSLRDIHVRHLILQVREWSDYQSFLVSKSVSRLDRERFRRLGLNIYELTISAFLEGLRSAMAR